MHVQVRFQGISPNPRVERYVASRLEGALDRLEAYVDLVVVRLIRDGEREVVYRVSTRLSPHRHLEVQGRRADLLDAVDEAAPRIAEAVERYAAKLRRQRHACAC